MLNHEPGQMDWDRFPIGGSSSNGYINPSNMYDQMTHVGREALAEATRHDEFEPPEVSDGSVAKIVKLEHAWRRLDGRNDDGFQVAPFPG